MRPRWRSASGSLRKRPKHQSAKAPREHQVFCPLQEPAVVGRGATARLRSAARSLPASGSDQPWHQISSPEAIGGRKRAFCSGVPCSSRVGPEEEDAVLADPARGPGPVVLLLEDQPLEDADAAPAVLGGPAHHRPPVGGQPALPAPGAARTPRRCPARPGCPGPGRARPARTGPRPGTPPGGGCRSGPSWRESDTPSDARQQWAHARRGHRRRGPHPGRPPQRAACRAGTRSTWPPSRCWPWSSATTSTRRSSRT